METEGRFGKQRLPKVSLVLGLYLSETGHVPPKVYSLQIEKDYYMNSIFRE